ncbi:hypothetical protein GR11A_00117 [Vibrio phage vB_VcorM_GR11A]|nr:hypothetical protein GR11A_00117 [Vibrio phage vB_VcorM_GR11A]
MANFDIEHLRDGKHKQVILAHSSGFTVTGFLEEDFDPAGGAQVEYSNPFEDYLTDKSEKLNQGTAVFNSLFGANIEQTQLKSRLNSISLWTGTSRPTFDIPITLIRHRTADQPITAITSELQSYLFPIADGGLESTLAAPGGYKIIEGGKASGTWTLSIGNWFRATGLILRAAPFPHSQVITVDDTPMFAKGRVTLEPYRMISSAEFRQYILLK